MKTSADVVPEKLIRVKELLEQLPKVNEMIALHRNGGDESMQRQYESIRQRFVDELQEILRTYQLNVHIEPEAA